MMVGKNRRRLVRWALSPNAPLLTNCAQSQEEETPMKQAYTTPAFIGRTSPSKRGAKMHTLSAVALLALMLSGLLGLAPQPAAAADNDLFQQMDIGFFSLGGRATYTDPKEGQSRWFGGAQVRVNPVQIFVVRGIRRLSPSGYSRLTYPYLPRASFCTDLPAGPHTLGPVSARRRRVVLHHGQRTGQLRRYPKSIRPPRRRRTPILFQ